MSSLTIPDAGLSLGNFPATSSKYGVVPEFLGLTLSDGVIEDMIKCFQNGKPIQLSLGEQPTLSYGTKHQTLSTFTDPFTHELYRTTNSDSDMALSGKTQSKPNTTMAGRMGKNILGLKGVNMKPWQEKTVAQAKPASTADSALAALQNSLASENAKKAENTTKYIKEGLPIPGKRGAGPIKVNNKTKFLSQNRSLANETTRSMPTSPALSGVGSPGLGPTSVPLSQQQAEHAKAARKPVIHLLAVEPMTEKEIQQKVPGVSEHDLNQALSKVGDVNGGSGKWELRRAFYKELDVHAFKYSNSEDRQRAIDNAVKAYDKMRLSASDPEWDRLLVKSERGTGKCLSKLQAQIVSRGPKINVESADSDRDTPAKEEDLFSDKNLSKVKGEGMARSSSQGPATKTKKVSEKEAQTKRLFSKNPAKAAAKSTPKAAPKTAPKTAPKATSKATTKATTTKKAPTKAGANSKILSSEFVNESDDDDDQPPPPPPKPVQKVNKRSREDEEIDTSDSSVPLSKKPRKEIAAPNHRVSDASQNSRTTNSSQYSNHSRKTKSNSPTKSSPLASSPPTNASEFEHSSTGGRTSSSTSPVHTTKISRSPIHKRHQKSSSVTSSSSSGSNRYLKPEVTDLARKFKMYYPKYQSLHKEIETMMLAGRRDKQKEQDLFEMHARLEGMKKDIFAGIVEY